jgi:hypothetical protein
MNKHIQGMCGIKERKTQQLYCQFKNWVNENMTMNESPHLSLLQRPCVAIFWQTFRFNSELNKGIPKHSSRGTQSASVVAPKKRRQNLLLVTLIHIYCISDKSLLNLRFLGSSCPSDIHQGAQQGSGSKEGGRGLGEQGVGIDGNDGRLW